MNYYRLYFDCSAIPYLDEKANSSEEAIEQCLNNEVYSFLTDKLLRVSPLKLYKAKYSYTVTEEVEVYAESEDEAKDTLQEWQEDLINCESVVSINTSSSLNNYKEIEEEE